MTPTAVTPAARTKRPGRPSPSSSSQRGATPRPASAASHRTASPRPTTPRPRRISGPAAPPRAPRPDRAPRRPAPAAPPATPVTGRGRRAVHALRTLPDHSLLDRIVRGRIWIPLLGVLLVGIVAAQVEVLKLNASIGHAMVRTAQLQTRNQLLRTGVSEASDDQRIEAAAVRLGMSMPAPTAPLFLGTGQGRLAQALRNIHAPDPGGFALRTQAAQQRRADSVMQTTGA